MAEISLGSEYLFIEANVEPSADPYQLRLIVGSDEVVISPIDCATVQKLGERLLEIAKGMA